MTTQSHFPVSSHGLLTLAEASAMLGVSKITLRRWTKSGDLQCVRIGQRQDRRFRRVDIEKFIVVHLEEPVAEFAPAGRDHEKPEIVLSAHTPRP